MKTTRCARLLMLLVTTSVSFISARTQVVEHMCGGLAPEQPSSPDRGVAGCTDCHTLNESLNFNSPYRYQQHYIPWPDDNVLLTALLPSGMLRPVVDKTIVYTIHVWQNSTGGENFTDTPTNRARMTEAFNIALDNNLGQPLPPSDPATPVPNYYLTNGRIRGQLRGIFFHTNTDLWDSHCINDQDALSMEADALEEDARGTIKLHIVKSNCCSTQQGMLLVLLHCRNSKYAILKASGKLLHAAPVALNSRSVIKCFTPGIGCTRSGISSGYCIPTLAEELKR